VLERQSNQILREKVERHCTIVDLIKQRKLKLDDRTRGRPARRWSEDVMDWCCTMSEAVELALEWRSIIASTAHMDHEF